MKPSSRQLIHSKSARKPLQTPGHSSRNASNPWKIGKYWANSGTLNPLLIKSSSQPTVHGFPPSREFPCQNTERALSKEYSSNTETKRGWDLKFSKVSMMNYQSRDYNFINLTVNKYRPETVTIGKQKVFGDYIDSCKTINKALNPTYQEAINKNLKVFYKQSGEFTNHHNNCVKLSGGGPFAKALGLLP